MPTRGIFLFTVFTDQFEIRALSRMIMPLLFIGDNLVNKFLMQVKKNMIHSVFIENEAAAGPCCGSPIFCGSWYLVQELMCHPPTRDRVATACLNHLRIQQTTQ